MKPRGNLGDRRRYGRFIRRFYTAVVSLCLLIGWVCVGPLVWAANLSIPQRPDYASGQSPPNVSFAEQQMFKDIARLNQEGFRRRVEIPAAVAPMPAELDEVQSGRDQVGLPAIDASKTASQRNLILVVLVGFLLGGIAFRKNIFAMAGVTELPWESPAILPAAADLSAKVRLEEEALALFLEKFNTPRLAAEVSAVAPAAGQDFLAHAAECLATLRARLQEAGRENDPVALREMLSDCHRQILQLNADAALTGLVTVKQLASGLEGLLKQVVGNTKNFTPSALRTIESGVELLAELAQPGQPTNLAGAIDIRLLVVDDDLISRNALAFALKRMFNAPDLASNGKDALALAETHAYDLIFLDVQMPGMDGFELCSRIHFSAANRATPVVFVTCHDDYASRARAVEVGGIDLMGKPFLTFELIAKALTLIYRNRLQTCKPEVGSAGKLPSLAARKNFEPPKNERRELAQRPLTAPASAEVSPSTPLPEESSAVTATMATALSAHISTNLAGLQRMLETLPLDSSADEQADELMDFYLLFHALAGNIELAKMRAASELSSAMETLIKRLIESPGLRTSSAAYTLSAAMELLAELCDGRVNEAASELPLRMLVLDADVTTRRIVIAALQTVFKKPDSEDDAASALVRVQDNDYDVAFVSLQIPGADGLTFGSKIRDGSAERPTPVVFLAGEEDYAASAESIRSKGMDVITKPILPVEINVKALTLALRRRTLPAVPGMQCSASAAVLSA